jgi:hypothetical protein
MQHGCNLADLIRHARRLGITIEPVRRTGELRFSHPRIPRRPRVNGRRKDSPRVVTDFFAEAERLQKG